MYFGRSWIGPDSPEVYMWPMSHRIQSVITHQSSSSIQVWTDIQQWQKDGRPQRITRPTTGGLNDWAGLALQLLGGGLEPGGLWEFTPMEKSVTKFGPQTKKFVTDGQKRDYLSHDSQRARGATKKKETRNAWQSLAISQLGVAVSPPSK